jgi:hypothetical protein
VAATVAGEQLSAQLYDDQLTMRSLLLYEQLRLWPLLDPLRLDETAAAWLELAVEAVAQFFTGGARTGAEYYNAIRTAETGSGLDEGFFAKAHVDGLPDLAELVKPNVEQIRTALTVTGPVGIKYRVGRGMNVDTAATRAFTEVSGAAQRLATNATRDTVQRLIVIDQPVAKGWRRTTGPHPCYFCAMLATRDVLYSSPQAAGPNRTSDRNPAGVREFVGPGKYKVHDWCQCGIEPVFAYGTPLTGVSKEFDDLYKDAVAKPGKQTLLGAFRSAYEKKYGRWEKTRGGTEDLRSE